MILVHIADLTNSVTQYDIEKVFMKYGEIKEVWMAKNPPCFAFVVFNYFTIVFAIFNYFFLKLMQKMILQTVSNF